MVSQCLMKLFFIYNLSLLIAHVFLDVEGMMSTNRRCPRANTACEKDDIDQTQQYRPHRF